MDLHSVDVIRYQLRYINEDKAPKALVSLIICFTLIYIVLPLQLISRRMCKAETELDNSMPVAASGIMSFVSRTWPGF